MRIQHNIAALNATRQLNKNSDATSKNLEKLSSGYKINSAADDAAGLAISEKMRSQISGLDQATNNANDGISLVQTAEGALNETTSILQRMKELATQSSNGTYQNAVDRENIQKEVTSLKSEIDRISTSTNFNKINLLDGSLSGNSSVTGGGKAATLGLSDVAKAAGAYGMTAATTGSFVSTVITAPTDATDKNVGFSVTYKDADGTTATSTINLTFDATNKTFKDSEGNAIGAVWAGANPTAGETADAIVAALNKDTTLSSKFTITNDGSDAVKLVSKESGTAGSSIVAFAESHTIAAGTTTNVAQASTGTAGVDAFESVKAAVGAFASAAGTNASDFVFTVNNQKFAYAATAADAAKFDSDVNYVIGAPAAADTAMATLIKQKTGVDATANAAHDIQFKASATSTATTGGLTLQIGANATADQQVSLNIGNMSTKGLGITGVDVTNQTNALASIKTIESAINQVSGTRADLGALQNRLEHTVANLGVTSENLTSAESRIRDVDMAKEMMEMTKNNILTSAAQSMLSQANQQPQNVLKLLQ